MQEIPKNLISKLAFAEEDTDFDEMINRLIGWCEAYPEDIFPPLEGFTIPIDQSTGDYDTKEKRNLISRASAHMGRHMIEMALKPAILHMRWLVDEIADRDRKIAELEAQQSKVEVSH